MFVFIEQWSKASMTEKGLTVFTEQYYNNVENDENYNNIYLTVASIISVYKTNLTNTNAHKEILVSIFAACIIITQ